jgi:hypothetical protein
MVYDEDKWPSGFAGGAIPEMGKEFRAKYLKLTERGAIDVNHDEVLEHVDYQGEHYAISVHTEPLDDPWFNGACYVDLMNPKVVKAFLDLTIEGYKKEAGEYFGKEIPGIFTDEPCYIQPKNWSAPDDAKGILPWSPCLPEFFEKRTGYPLSSILKQLFYPVDGFRKARFDFFDAATRLFRESFTKQYYAACEQAGLIFTGHFLAEESLDSQMQWIGAAMPQYEFMHWPGIDKLCRHVDQNVQAKQVTSVADQLGKERVLCEVFGCSGQQFDFRGRRWLHNWEAALGINFVNHHLSLYTMMGERKSRAGMG